MILFYVLGIPLCVAFHLWRHRDIVHTLIEVPVEDLQKNGNRNQKLDKFKVKFSFLFSGYRTEAYLWESAVLCRKAFISMLAVFLNRDTHTQGLAGLVLLFIAITLQSKYQPFQTHHLNDLEFWSLTATICVFFAGQFTFADSGAVQGYASATAVIISVLYLVFVVYTFYNLFKQVRAQKAEMRRKSYDKRGSLVDRPSALQMLPAEAMMLPSPLKVVDFSHATEEVEMQAWTPDVQQMEKTTPEKPGVANDDDYEHVRL